MPYRTKRDPIDLKPIITIMTPAQLTTVDISNELRRLRMKNSAIKQFENLLKTRINGETKVRLTDVYDCLKDFIRSQGPETLFTSDSFFILSREYSRLEPVIRINIDHAAYLIIRISSGVKAASLNLR